MRSPNSSEVSIPPTLGGGTLVTDRPALIIDISLRKHAAQLAFPGASRMTGCATRATFGLGLRHQHLRPIHLHVQVWNRRASDDRKPELLAALDVLLLPGLNVCSDRFGGSSYRLRSHFPICPELELLAALSKRRLASDSCEHAPNAGREIVLPMASGTSSGNCPLSHAGH